MPDPWENTGARPDPSPAIERRPSRRERVRAEIERNRRGEYRIPTWVLALALGLVLVGWLTLILLD